MNGNIRIYAVGKKRLLDPCADMQQSKVWKDFCAVNILNISISIHAKLSLKAFINSRTESQCTRGLASLDYLRIVINFVAKHFLKHLKIYFYTLNSNQINKFTAHFVCK